MRLTKRAIDALEPRDREYFARDADVAGFGVRVSPSGQKTYALRYRYRSRQRRFSIARVGAITIEEARREARRLLGQIVGGSDPSADRRQLRSIPTMREFADFYMERHATPRKKTAAADRSMLDRYVLPRFGALPIDEVSRGDIVDLHQRVSRQYPTQANRVSPLRSEVFSLAVLMEHRSDNPATRIPKNRESRREVFLGNEEISRLGEALEEAQRTRSESPYAIAAIRLLLLTGCRRDEILTLRWSEVDFPRGLLHLSDSKTGPRIVQLNAPAMQILNALESIESRDLSSPWVIQGRRAQKRLVGISRPWQRIREAAGLGHVRLHDLRHTFASVAAGRGESLLVIGSILGHRAPATTARYAHLTNSPRRSASERTAARIDELLRSRPEIAEVSPIQGSAS